MRPSWSPNVLLWIKTKPKRWAPVCHTGRLHDWAHTRCHLAAPRPEHLRTPPRTWLRHTLNGQYIYNTWGTQFCDTALKLTEVWRDGEDHVGAADPNTRRGTGTDLIIHKDTLSIFWWMVKGGVLFFCSRPDGWDSSAAGPRNRPEHGCSGRGSPQTASRMLCCRSSRGSHDPVEEETTLKTTKTRRRWNLQKLTVWRMRMWASCRTSAVTTWG